MVATATFFLKTPSPKKDFLGSARVSPFLHRDFHGFPDPFYLLTQRPPTFRAAPLHLSVTLFSPPFFPIFCTVALTGKSRFNLHSLPHPSHLFDHLPRRSPAGSPRPVHCVLSRAGLFVDPPSSCDFLFFFFLRYHLFFVPLLLPT